MVKTVVEGELLKLTCTVEDNVGDVEFEWVTTELGGMEGEIVNISSTTNSTTLSVKKMLVEYEGIYSCMASDYFFSVTNNFTVAVQGEASSALCVCVTINTMELIATNESRMYLSM